ncbi:hypothetical protein ACFL1T_00945 [Chlamydiota bacterium]
MYALRNKTIEEDFIKSINYDLITGKEEAFNRFIIRYQEPVYQFSYKLLANHSLSIHASRDTFVILHKLFKKSQITNRNVKECILKAGAKACTKYGTIISTSDLIHEDFDLNEHLDKESQLPPDFLYQVLEKIYNNSKDSFIPASTLDSLFIKITTVCVILILIVLIYWVFSAKTHEINASENVSFIVPEVVSKKPPLLSVSNTVLSKHIDLKEVPQKKLPATIEPIHAPPIIIEKPIVKPDPPKRKPLRISRYLIVSSDINDTYFAFRASLPSKTQVYVGKEWSKDIPNEFSFNPLFIRIPKYASQQFLESAKNLLTIKRMSEYLYTPANDEQMSSSDKYTILLFEFSE